MKKKLTLRCLLISLITAIIVFAAALGVVFWLYDETEAEDIREKTHLLIAALKSSEDPSAVLAAIEDTRVTLLDKGGDIVYDSGGTEENHSDREEIVAAMNDAPKVVRRYSQTMQAYICRTDSAMCRPHRQIVCRIFCQHRTMSRYTP